MSSEDSIFFVGFLINTLHNSSFMKDSSPFVSCVRILFSGYLPWGPSTSCSWLCFSVTGHMQSSPLYLRLRLVPSREPASAGASHSESMLPLLPLEALPHYLFLFVCFFQLCYLQDSVQDEDGSSLFPVGLGVSSWEGGTKMQSFLPSPNLSSSRGIWYLKLSKENM